MATIKKKTKTWKLGEVAQGGVITVEITGDKIDVIGKEWDYSKGSNKGSDQSKAEEFCRTTFKANSMNVQRELADELCRLTTSYYADEITKWIESQVNLYKSLWW